MTAIAIIGAAETSRIGIVPEMSQLQLFADTALGAAADAGIKGLYMQQSHLQ